MISWRAIGLYWYLSSTGSRINSEALSDKATEGDRAVRTALNELREAGILKTRKERIGGRIMTVNVLVEPQYWPAETAGLILEILRNSNNYVISNFYKDYPDIPAKPVEKENFLKVNLEGVIMSDFPAAYDPDDIDGVRRRRDRDKHEEKEYTRVRKQEKRMDGIKHRSVDPTPWSASDSALEFQSRLFSLMHVTPWRVGVSRFRIALAKARSTYGTDGMIEYLMYDRFFKRIKNDMSLTNPEIIWKIFIKEFGKLAEDARRSNVTTERLETAEIQSTRSKDKLKLLLEEEGL